MINAKKVNFENVHEILKHFQISKEYSKKAYKTLSSVVDKNMEVPQAFRFLYLCLRINNLNFVPTNQLFITSRFKKFFQNKGGFICNHPPLQITNSNFLGAIGIKKFLKHVYLLLLKLSNHSKSISNLDIFAFVSSKKKFKPKDVEQNLSEVFDLCEINILRFFYYKIFDTCQYI